LWIEFADHDEPSRQDPSGQRAVRTLQTEKLFWTILVTASQDKGRAEQVAGLAAERLAEGQPPDVVTPAVLGTLPPGEYVPLALLHVVGGTQAYLVEVDAPPLFLVRRGRLVLLPVVEEEVQGRLVRQCEFALQEGDHLAMVSAEYIRAKGWDRRWGWRDIALSIRRLTDTGCDARQLLGALVRMYHRLAQGEPAPAVTVIAMHVRPVRSVTVWSGPPADPASDARAVERLLAEPGRRIVCGDTTAAVAARILGASLEQEPRPAEGWAEVPPTWRLEGVDLVTEGVVTLRKARERLRGAAHAADLPRANDGATRLARLLLEADVIRFFIGTAVNPAQRDGAVSWRQEVIGKLLADLKARGKIVSVEYLGEESWNVETEHWRESP
jgi:hypothetical protein